MKRIYKNSGNLLLLLIILLAGSCEKQPTDYRSFINGHEKTYPAAVNNVQIFPGNNRLLLKWTPNSDPSVKKYIIYWNDGMDSSIVQAKSHDASDTVNTYIDDLEEGIHSFEIYSFDNKENISVPAYVENIRIYGEKYQSNLLNRPISNVNYTNGILSINWGIPDTINVGTEVKYTNTSDDVVKVFLAPDSNKLIIPDWKLPTKIYYKSSYIPVSNAIDTFKVSYYDSLTVSNLPVDKSLWKQVMFPHDANVSAYGTSLTNIWDGEPGAYPDVYHTDGAYIPHTFTIDLGRTYKELTQFEEWGRTDFDGHNPNDFEIWGIEDTTEAIPALSPTDPGWKDEIMAKGWTLLGEVKRNDDGIAGMKTDLISDLPPVRFIHIRVLHAVDDGTASHMSEISFWYNP